MVFRSYTKKIVYIVNHCYPLSSNGYAIRTHGIAKALLQQGIGVVVASRPGLDWGCQCAETDAPWREDHMVEGVRYVKLIKPFATDGLSDERYCELAAEELKKWIQISRPTCVMAASNWRIAWPASIAAAESGLPFFYDVRGFWELTQASSDPNWVQSEQFFAEVSREIAVLQSAEKIFTINRFMREELVKRGCDRDRLELVPNGVDRRAQAQNNRPNNEFLPCQTRTLLYTGSFNSYEGLEDLIQAAAQLHRDGMDLSLTLLGSSTNGTGVPDAQGCRIMAGYQKQAAELGFGDRLLLPGRVEPHRLGSYYDKADVVVIPRRPVPVAELVSPLKPMEALLHGKKVLMSDVAPLKELETVSTNFYYFQKGNLSSLVAALKNLLSPEEVAKQPAPAPDFSQYSWKKCVEPIVNALESISKREVYPVLKGISSQSQKKIESLPWQFPNRTEQVAAESHRATDRYLAVPWASRIDLRAGDNASSEKYGRKNFRSSAILLESLHTVCQHVYWQEAAEDWAEEGVTDVWLSHAAETGIRPDSMALPVPLPRIHAWPLYAVNVEDSERREGLIIGKNPRAKRYLASFIGAHMSHYISESRLKLEMHARNPSFYIKSTGDQWHYKGVVYEHQIDGKPLESVYRIDDSVEEYNRVLSDSVFALCPAGLRGQELILDIFNHYGAQDEFLISET